MINSYHSKFDPEIEYEIWFRCHLYQLPLHIANKLPKSIKVYKVGLWQLSNKPFLAVINPGLSGGAGMQKKEFPLDVGSDHDYLHIHVENALKKAHEHIAQLHGNTKAQVEGFDLFA